MIAFLWILSLSLFPFTASHASTNDVQWDEFRKSYDAGKYQEAIDQLQRQRALAGDEPGYFYNLGNAYYRQGNLGLAVAYFEKALKLSPHDSDFKHNLRLARTKLVEQVGENRVDPASTWLESVFDVVSIEEVRGVFGAMMLFTVFAWIRPYLRTRNILAALGHPAGLFCALAVIFSFSLLFLSKSDWVKPPAICIKKDVVRSGPGSSYVELAAVDAGVKLRLTGDAIHPSDDWSQVRYGPDLIGWIPSQSLLPL